MNITRTLSRAFNDVLKPVGFVKKGSTWYLQGDEVIGVLSLQKSNYDDTFFLNLGFWLRELGDTDTPRDEQCHVRGRAERIWPNRKEMISTLLNFSEESDDVEPRLRDIQKFVRECVIPLLQHGATLGGITEILRNNKGLQVRRVAWDKLEVNKESES